MISSDASSSSHNDNSEEALRVSDEIGPDIINLSNSSKHNAETSIRHSKNSINNLLQPQIQIHSQNNRSSAISDTQNGINNNNDIFKMNDSDKIAVNEIQSSIFAQIAHISEFLANGDENFQNKKSNPCFQMLSDFFDVFNEQLRINFKIRNKLNEEIKKNPVNPEKVDEKRKEIENFLKEFKGMVSTSKKDYSHLIDIENIEKSFNNIISIIQNGIKKTAKLKKLSKEIENKQKEIASINNEIASGEKRLQDVKNNTEDRSSSIQKQIDQSQDQISKMRIQIDELSPNITEMKTKIQNEANLRKNLSEMIAKRKNQIEIAHQSFYEEQNKQKKKRQKLGVKLSKLKIERRQLLIDEQPLFSALKEAEDEFEKLKKQAENDIDLIKKEKSEIENQLEDLRLRLAESQKKKEDQASILQQKKEEASKCSVKINEIDVKTKKLKKNILQIAQQKRSILHDLNQKNINIKNKVQKNFENKHKINDQDLDLNSNNYSDEENSFNENNNAQKGGDGSNSHEIDDLILNLISEELMHLEELTSQSNIQIEEIRKDNSKTRSMIRVNKDKISKLIDENQKLRTTISLSEKEVEKLNIEANAQKQRYALFKSTMNEYNRMRTALGFHNTMLPSEVAKHAVAIIRSWKQVEFDDEREKDINGKISYNSINEEFECIFGEINDVESRLYGTSP
ncbi:hypothetical protein M9Y10_005909 [Tritrichomonas musculus]|uniref:Uncharacterized protein n=1 Tax=Tritrichomonas musculus TaxID=1915356 RepID=A0ABR2JCU6_9EUKA